MAWTLITGASGGLGGELARVLAGGSPRGLILTGRDAAALAAIARELEPRVPVYVAVQDLGVPGAVDALAGELRGAGIPPEEITTVICNAATGYLGPFARQPRDAVTATVQLNVTALTELVHWLVPYLQKSTAPERRICLVASVASFSPGPRMAVYYATKAYVLSLGEALHEELRGTGITVTVACPAPFRSAFHQRAGIPPASGAAVPRAATVARRIVRGMDRRRAVVPVGFAAWVWALAAPRLPRRWSRSIMHRVQKRRGGTTEGTTEGTTGETTG